MTALPTGTHSIPLLASLYESYRSVNTMNPSEKIQEATFVPTVAGSATQGSKVRDHVPFGVIIVIKVMPLRTLVDNRATHSFVDEKLQLCPPFHFIGAYSSLEMVNGETIFSTRIAPRCSCKHWEDSVLIRPNSCSTDGGF